MSIEKRLGILGGTFDPVHLGHLQIAQHIWRTLNLESIRFIPCYRPALRPMPLASGHDRLEMLHLALQEFPHFLVDDREIRRQGYSYTIDTLKSLKTDYPQHALYFILGKDAYASFTKWRCWQDILTLAHLIVVHRAETEKIDSIPPSSLLSQHTASSIQTLFSTNAGKIFFLTIEPIPISASLIRNLLSQHKNAHEFLHPAVEHYIQQKGLYLPR